MASSFAPGEFVAHPSASRPAAMGGGPLASLADALRWLGRVGRVRLLAAMAPADLDPQVALRAAGPEFRHLADGWTAGSAQDIRWEMTLAARYGRRFPGANRRSTFR